VDRRHFLCLGPAALAVPALQAQQAPAAAPAPRRPVPHLPGGVPPIGMGTWLTFDVGDDPGEVAQRRDVLQRFFAAGGGLIDSSPMYGRAERLLGELLPTVPHAGPAGERDQGVDAVRRLGAPQLELSLKLWREPRFDVLLVHNLLNWRAHLKTLRQWKDEGRVRAIGVSTSHGSRHDDAERAIRSEPLDVLQITYNLADRRAEPLMNLAAERGLAVVVNRRSTAGRCSIVSQAPRCRRGRRRSTARAGRSVFLKWVVAHPAVACAIPATRRPQHMDENMGAGRGRLPDVRQRQRILAALATP
jgi:aryl-alcohol dehydrogenase-like predicted oxidoreductase